jgi:hypothetical protein
MPRQKNKRVFIKTTVHILLNHRKAYILSALGHLLEIVLSRDGVFLLAILSAQRYTHHMISQIFAMGFTGWRQEVGYKWPLYGAVFQTCPC